MRIRFVVSGGSTQGLGHLMRCAVLARAALRSGHTASFALRGDSGALEILAGEIGEAAIVAWNSSADAVRDADAVVLDTPDPLDAELAEARSRGLPTVMLDRMDHLDGADATVLPVLHGPAIEHPRLHQGPEWCLLAEAVQQRAAVRSPGIRNIGLVTFGGADPLRLTVPIARALAKAVNAGRIPGAVELNGVIGPAFADGKAVGTELAAGGFRVHERMRRSKMVGLMANSLFALAGFGTSVYDLAALGTPVVYWTHRTADVQAAQRLEERGIGAFGGNGRTLAESDVRAVLERTVLDAEWRARTSEQGRALLATADGGARIVELIESLASGREIVR